MNKAKEKGFIRGVIPHLVEGGLTHLQYADDTILMCGGDKQSIGNMKFLLYCFEWLSGLQINYHKGEVVVFGVETETETKIARMLNCQIGELPMKYLGFPISDKRLGCSAFRDIVGKMGKKLQPWKGKNLNSGGRLVLTNSSLSSMPIYMISMFHLYGEVHQQTQLEPNFFGG
jgi:hypothetical protein